MKPLFDLVDNALKEPVQGGEKLGDYIAATESELKGADLSKNELLEYALKRFIRAATVGHPTTKENASWGLRHLLELQHQHVDFARLLSFLTETTDSKNALKKNQVAHLVIGRIMILQTAAPYLGGHQKAAWRLMKQSIDSDLGEQALQTLYELLKVHPSKKVLAELEAEQLGRNRKIELFRSLVCQQLKHQKVDHSIELFDEVAGFMIADYPKQNYIVRHLVQTTKWSASKWQECWSHLVATHSDETKNGFKGIYFILEVLKELSKTHFNKETLECVLHKQLMDLWMNQLVVLNKNCKELALNIQLNIGDDEELAFRLLEFMHDQKVVIGNIQKKHPLQALYRIASPAKFLKYLLARLDADYNEDELCEAYAFIRLTTKELPGKLVVKVMRKLLEQRRENELAADKYYGMLWSLVGWKLNHLSSKAEAKKEDHIAQGKLLLDIYNKLKAEQDGGVDKVAEYVSGLVEAADEKTSERMKTFIHFAAAVVLWSGLTGEEVETCQQLQLIGPDLLAYVNLVEATEAPRKKRKAEDPKKPIHVLVEVFIAYLTRAPNFLRDAVEGCFKTLVSDFDKSDLSTLIAVLTRPDNEYIENEPEVAEEKDD